MVKTIRSLAYRLKMSAAILSIVLSCATATAQTPKNGKQLFESKCARCHGKTGTRGLFGAANLQISALNDSDLYSTISAGRNIMPSWRKRLDEAQIKIIIDYIKTFRK